MLKALMANRPHETASLYPESLRTRDMGKSPRRGPRRPMAAGLPGPARLLLLPSVSLQEMQLLLETLSKFPLTQRFAVCFPF